MLGRFLEYSIATADIGASYEFYSRLGFTSAEVGEAWPYPYAVLTDGRVCLGLHQRAADEPAMTFVRPRLSQHLAVLAERGIDPTLRRLGSDVFNELGWHDPSGHLVRILEARTFSPTERTATERSLCGYFLEIALPAPDVERAKDHWETLGFVGMEEPDAPLPHVACTSDTVDVGLYDLAQLAQPALHFESDDLAATRRRLEAAGAVPSARLPRPLQRASAAALQAPEGTYILITAAAG